MGCARCGGAPAVSWEQCYINEDTKSKLVAHADQLRTFGVTLEEPPPPLQKDAGTTMTAIGLVISLSEALYPGGLRKLLLFLRDIAIPEEEILRLRLDEPENVSEVVHDPLPRPKSTRFLERDQLRGVGIDISGAKQVRAIAYEYPDGTKRVDLTYQENDSLQLISGSNIEDIRLITEELMRRKNPDEN